MRMQQQARCFRFLYLHTLKSKVCSEANSLFPELILHEPCAWNFPISQYKAKTILLNALMAPT